MKRLLIILLMSLLMVVTLTRCNSNHNDKINAKKVETKIETVDIETVEEVAPPKMSDLFEIVELYTGFSTNFVPFVYMKLRNISGSPVTDVVRLKFIFVNKDEIIDDTGYYVHGYSDMPWDNGLCKSAKLSSKWQFDGWPANGSLRTKVVFEDGSIIYNGNVNNKFYR